ncbi:sugar transferase [Actinopolymorpha alba]|uniref:sugar transferase n=1 Tax=Actinopolymorpha alba TaxID=533267 RepID=UPI0003750965|nr:sugar transferase [Actinopolymorpha alba]
MTRRVFEVLTVVVLLALSLPVLLAVAILIKVCDGGPVLFRQERIGRYGRRFDIHKFRTMRGSDRIGVTSSTDTRITRLGRTLRATKLDELPQLYDVLRGRMSLVGPRPELARYVECWPSEARERILSVRPGITDPASIVYRHEADELAWAPDPEGHYVTVVLPRKVDMYLRYVETRSFLGDLAILARTIPALLSRSQWPEGCLTPAQAGVRTDRHLTTRRGVPRHFAPEPSGIAPSPPQGTP